MSNLFNLDSADYIKGLAIAVLAAVLTALAQAINMPGFDFATFQWTEVVRIAMVAALSYLAKNFASDHEGKLLGKI